MNRPLVVPRYTPETPSRRALARSEASRLRQDVLSAVDGKASVAADRLEAIANLLDSLAGNGRSASAEEAPEARRAPASADRVQSDLAALMTRSVERGGNV
jgi:hypothetical protein